MSFRNIIMTVGTVLVAAAIAVLATIYFADRNISAQTQGAPNLSTPKPVKPAPQPPAAQASPAAPAAGPVRTETITYDAWTVNCRDTPDGKSKRICSATLPMVLQQQNQRVTVGGWIIAHNNEGALLSCCRRRKSTSAC